MNDSGKVILNITISLDGFIAGPNASPSNPLGDEGIRLHDWLFKAKTDLDVQVIQDLVETSGAVIVGGRTYHDAIDTAWGGTTPFLVPAIVVTKNTPSEKKDGFIFVAEGIEEALKRAKLIAAHKNIWVMGGATVIQQFLAKRLFDELHIDIAPVMFMKGKKLFEGLGDIKIELQNVAVVQTPQATHLKFRRS